MKKDLNRAKKIVSGAYDLSLGISIVIAVLLGVGIGIMLKQITGFSWLLWLGVFWGVGAGILNIYKAYCRAQKELEELAKDIKYTSKQDKKDV